MAPEDENRTGEVVGPMTFVGQEGRDAYLEIGSEAGYMPIRVIHGAGYPADLLLKSRVRVRGTCIGIHAGMDGKTVPSLVVSNMNDVTILQVPEETWQRYPIATNSAAWLTNLPGAILRLRGKIQTVKPGRSFLLTNESGQLIVSTKQAQALDDNMDVEVLGAWQQHGSNRVFQSALFRPITEATNQQFLPTLTSTEQIRWLKPDEAGKGYPVKLRGTVTFMRTDQKGANLQDGTGGIFLWRFALDKSAGKKIGDYCEVEGVTLSGDIAPMISPRKITVLGLGQFPEPAQPNWDELIHGGLDACWVEIKGVALPARNRNLSVLVKGGEVLCAISGRDTLRNYSGAVVRVRGVLLPRHDTQRHIIAVQINVPSQRFISVVVPPPADIFSLPTLHAGDLFTYNPGQPDFRQVKVAGLVVNVRNGVCHLMDGTNGIRLIPTHKTLPEVGDLVEAVGFPDIDSPFDKPILTMREAAVRRTGSAPLPAAANLSPEDLINRAYDSTRVRLQSRLLDVSKYGAEEVLELQSGSHIYRGRLNTAGSPFPSLQLGSLLDLSGVYVVSADRSVPFELLLNSTSDIRVLQLPSWWTVQHAILVISAMTAVILLGLIWIAMLRRQVEKRTAQLSEANKSLKTEIAERVRTENELVQTRSRHAVEQERTRIARDLHDDLGSRVTRTVLLLDELALQNQMPPPTAPQHPVEISSAAREIIQSLDETVWAVNPRNDTLPRLINYLSQFATEFLQTANVRCRLDFPDHPPQRAISAEVRHNLFLATKEALNNAVRHAQATEVWLRGVASEESLVLTVEDNGRGFDPSDGHSSANGLRNMLQRMEEIGGKFRVETQPGKGTRVSLFYPWSKEE